MVSQSQSPAVGGRRAVWLNLIAIAVVVLSYGLALFGAESTLTSEEPAGYYGLTTDALTSGQLYWKLAPDPGLATLANPWAGAQGIPRAHDATYFHGHYYLYFGVTPVMILLAPWHLLFGNYLNEATATFLFGLVGFLLCVRLWLRLKRNWFPTLGAIWTAAGILMIGLGNYVYFLLETPVFYHVPIICGFVCLVGAFSALEGALESRLATGRQAALLALASLCWGLSIGARPNYVFSLPLLGLVALILAVKASRARGLWRAKTLRIFWAAIIPAGVVGLGLAWYNYARFGDIAEFGVRYQFASIDQRFLKLTDPANLAPTLHSYLWAGATYTPYYPFIEEKLDVIGVLIWAPFAALAVLAPIVWFRAYRRSNDTWPILFSVLLLAPLLHLFSLGLLPFANDRYVVDFLPAVILIALAAAAECIGLVQRNRWLSGAVKVALLILGIDTLVHANLLALQRNSSPAVQKDLAVAGNYLAPVWEKLFKVKLGRADLVLSFAEAAPGTREPIVSTGEGKDLIYAERTGPDHIRFGFFHVGSGGPTGDSIPIEIGKPYHISVDLGSLYPPEEHPAFRGWDEAANDALHRRVEVRFEGRKVLEWTSSFYDSNPFLVQIGRNTKTAITSRHLSGNVASVERAGLPSQDQIPSLPGDGAVKIAVKFPAFSAIISQPIISTGRPGAGDLIYVTYLSPTLLRFGHDSWGAGAVETLEANYDPSQDHVVEIDMGSLHARATGLMESKQQLKIRFDGSLLISTYRPFHASSPLDVSLGYNTTRSSAASPFFNGPLLTAQRITHFPDPPPVETGWGPIRLVIKADPIKGAREPLLVSGSPGAADFIYIVYDDETHLRVGLDHWGVGGELSGPIAVDFKRPLNIIISTSALYPPAIAEQWAQVPTTVQQQLLSSAIISVNGRNIIRSSRTSYPAKPSEIYIGRNPIGGSSCSFRFSGVIEKTERLKLGAPLE